MNLLSIERCCGKVRRVNQLIDERKLPAQKIGSQYVINESDLEKVTIHGKPGRPAKAENEKN